MHTFIQHFSVHILMHHVCQYGQATFLDRDTMLYHTSLFTGGGPHFRNADTTAWHVCMAKKQAAPSSVSQTYSCPPARRPSAAWAPSPVAASRRRGLTGCG